MLMLSMPADFKFVKLKTCTINGLPAKVDESGYILTCVICGASRTEEESENIEKSGHIMQQCSNCKFYWSCLDGDSCGLGEWIDLTTDHHGKVTLTLNHCELNEQQTQWLYRFIKAVMPKE